MRITLLVLVLFLSACNSRKEKLARTWLFQKAVFTEGRTDPIAEVVNPMNLGPSSFLNLQEDGSYTSYFGHYEQGSWQSKSDTLILNPTGGWKIIPFQVRKNLNGKLELFYAPRQAIYTFNGYDHIEHASGLENPFSYSNNKWRQKPDHPESDREITERLKNHFRFYETYFAWADRLNASTIEVNNVPSPLKIYSNGFELTHYSIQPYEWQQCFYDTADVRKAYLKLYYLFYAEDLDWKEKEHRFKMFASAYRQLQQKLK